MPEVPYTNNAKLFQGSLVVLGVLIVAIGVGALPAPVEAPVRPVVTTDVSILFVGDLMLDRNVARSAVAGGGARALFSTSTLDLFSSVDLRVANLEGTITTNPSIAQRDSSILRFTFDPPLAHEVLQLLNLSAVSSANNHALDFGEFGYDDTRSYLEQWGVASFGHPFNESHLSTTLTAQSKTVCLVGYMELFNPDTTAVLQEIARIRPDCWRVVVMPHWGIEYQATSTVAQQREADSFIDAGADLVIGAHPHVVEPVAIYRDKAVFYSLGNFMFDQNFSEATQRGLAVRVDFTDAGTNYTLIPLSVSRQYSAVASGTQKEPVLKASGAVAQFRLP